MNLYRLCPVSDSSDTSGPENHAFPENKAACVGEAGVDGDIGGCVRLLSQQIGAFRISQRLFASASCLFCHNLQSRRADTR